MSCPMVSSLELPLVVSRASTPGWMDAVVVDRTQRWCTSVRLSHRSRDGGGDTVERRTCAGPGRSGADVVAEAGQCKDGNQGRVRKGGGRGDRGKSGGRESSKGSEWKWLVGSGRRGDRQTVVENGDGGGGLP